MSIEAKKIEVNDVGGWIGRAQGIEAMLFPLFLSEPYARSNIRRTEPLDEVAFPIRSKMANVLLAPPAGKRSCDGRSDRPPMSPDELS